MEEVEKMYEKAYKLKEDEHRFYAAIQGVDLGQSDTATTKAEEVIERARAKAMGVSEEELESDGAFEYIDED